MRSFRTFELSGNRWGNYGKEKILFPSEGDHSWDFPDFTGFFFLPNAKIMPRIEGVGEEGEESLFSKIF